MFETFDDVVFAARAADNELPSTILAAVADEVRLMMALGKMRRTQKVVDSEVRDAQARFKDLVNKYSRDQRPLSPDDVIRLRSIAHLAWAVAAKVNQPRQEAHA